MIFNPVINTRALFYPSLKINLFIRLEAPERDRRLMDWFTRIVLFARYTRRNARVFLPERAEHRETSKERSSALDFTRAWPDLIETVFAE